VLAPSAFSESRGASRDNGSAVVPATVPPAAMRLRSYSTGRMLKGDGAVGRLASDTRDDGASDARGVVAIRAKTAPVFTLEGPASQRERPPESSVGGDPALRQVDSGALEAAVDYSALHCICPVTDDAPAPERCSSCAILDSRLQWIRWIRRRDVRSRSARTQRGGWRIGCRPQSCRRR